MQDSECTLKRLDLLRVFAKSEYFLESNDALNNIVITTVKSLLKKKYSYAGSSSRDGDYDRLMNLGNILADTIRMNEIATRLNGAEGYTDFCPRFPVLQRPSCFVLSSFGWFMNQCHLHVHQRRNRLSLLQM